MQHGLPQPPGIVSVLGILYTIQHSDIIMHEPKCDRLNDWKTSASVLTKYYVQMNKQIITKKQKRNTLTATMLIYYMYFTTHACLPGVVLVVHV